MAGIAWREAFIGGGVATIGAAVSAGLAVAALSRRVAPADTIDVAAKFGLPPLPKRDVMLYSTVTDRRGRDAVRTLIAAIRSTATH
jgi:DNA-binding transcriptional LysR family regulator